MFLKSKVKRKKAKFITVLTLVMLVLAGCRGKEDVAVQPSVVPMRHVTDDLGRNVTIPTKITRVVSLAPNLTENIFAVGAGERLVGVTTFCNYPEQAKTIAKIGDTMNPNMESIVALKPDIVFVSTASQIEAFMKTLEANGIAVYVMDPDSLEGVFHNLRQFGELFGTQETADELVADLQKRVSYVWDKVGKEKPVRVFVQISKEPLFTVGKPSFLTAVLEKAGAESVTADVATAFPKLNPEAALALNPDAIIISESPDNQEPNGAFKSSPAVKNGRIYKVSADLLSRPGPRLVDALEQIAVDLHPEKFRNK